MKIINSLKSTAKLAGVFTLTFTGIVAAFWTATSTDKIYSFIGEKYESYAKERKDEWLANPVFDSRAVSTISVNSLESRIQQNQKKLNDEKRTQELLVNELSSSLDLILDKDNLHNHMKKARLVVSGKAPAITFNGSCKGISIDNLLSEKNLSGEQFIQSLKNKRRITEGYKSVQESVFKALLNESCRIYKGRYSKNQIALISAMATNTIIQAETM